MRESPGNPTGAATGNKEAIDGGGPSTEPRRGGAGWHDHIAGLQCCFCFPGSENWHVRISSVQIAQKLVEEEKKSEREALPAPFQAPCVNGEACCALVPWTCPRAIVLNSDGY